MRTTPPLRVRVINLRYTTGTPPATFTPSTLDRQLIRSWLRRAYPTHQVVIGNRIVDSINAWPFTCGQANAQVAAIRALDVAGGMDARTHYYGLVADGGGFMRGCSAVPSNPNPAAIGSGPTGPGTFGWDNDGSYGDWYTAHELGHSFGRSHVGGACGATGVDPNYPFDDGQLANANGEFVGLDVGDTARGLPMAALPGVPWHDVMSYCDNQWISSYTFVGIRNRLVAEGALAPGATPPGAGPMPGDVAASMHGAMPDDAEAELAGPPDIETGADAPPEPVLGGEFDPQAIGEAGDAPGEPKPYSDEFKVPEPDMEAPPPVIYGSDAVAGDPQISRLQDPDAAQIAAAIENPDATIEEGRFIKIIALVNVTKNEGEMTSVSVVPRVIQPTAPPGGGALVKLLDSAGKVIAAHPVDVMLHTDLEPGQDVTALIDAAVPYIDGVASIELEISDETVDVRKVSSSRPELDNLRVPSDSVTEVMRQGAEAKTTARVTWEADDADGDKLTYSVQISGDRGKTWDTVAYGLVVQEFELTGDIAANLDNIQIRIIANDGFHTTILTGDVIE